jgi:hypothetical protein
VPCRYERTASCAADYHFECPNNRIGVLTETISKFLAVHRRVQMNVASSDRHPIYEKSCPDYQPSEFAKRHSVYTTTADYRYILLPTGLNHAVCADSVTAGSTDHRNLAGHLIYQMLDSGCLIISKYEFQLVTSNLILKAKPYLLLR